MNEKTTDRRTLKTQKAIRNALAELLMEKELRKVTVQDIADRAEINRATFYKHFLDIYDLYDKTEQEVLVEISLLILQLGERPPSRLFADLVDYIDKNREVFRLIFSPNNTGMMREKLARCIDGLFRQVESETYSIELGGSKLCYQTCYRSQGCIAVLERWVREGFTEPKDFIVKTITELDTTVGNLISARHK